MAAGTAMANQRAGFMTARERDKSLRTLQLYLEGTLWKNMKASGGYSWSEFSRKLVEFPDLAKAFAEARKASGHSMEDKALVLAEELVGPNEFSGSQVQAHKAAMEQYRWSASRRNPAEYAEAGAKQVSVVVPIQINSSLDLADGHTVAVEQPKSVWEVQADWVTGNANGQLAASPDVDSVPEVENHQPEPETALMGLENPQEALAEQLGLPERVQSAVPRRKSTGRPRKKHKTERQTLITANDYARMKKSPSVAAALERTENKNGPSRPARGKTPRYDPGDQSV